MNQSMTKMTNYIYIYLFIYSFIHSFIHLSIHSFMHHCLINLSIYRVKVTSVFVIPGPQWLGPYMVSRNNMNCKFWDQDGNESIMCFMESVYPY